MHRQPAAFLLSILLVACGGGGGGDSSSSGDSKAAAAATAIPEFTRGFAQFNGTPSAIAAGDLDGDRADDVVVVTSARDEVYAFYQRAAGPMVKFAPTAPASAEDRTVSTALCDVDGDGRNEILVGYALGELDI